MHSLDFYRKNLKMTVGFDICHTTLFIIILKAFLIKINVHFQTFYDPEDKQDFDKIFKTFPTFI